MKKIIFLLFVLAQSHLIFAQNIVLDFTFIKAENIAEYDDQLNTYFKVANQKMIDDGQALGWHVWKVINGPQTPFTHVAVTTYDLDKMDEDYKVSSWAERLPDITEDHLQLIGQSINANRKIVFSTTVLNVAEVMQTGVTTIPDIAVMNLMKAKQDKYKSYEDFEKSMTKSIPTGNPRKGWSLARRIDRVGTEMSWTHFTVDWYDKYSDFLKTTTGPAWDADKSYQELMKLRDLTDSVVLEKFIFLNN